MRLFDWSIGNSNAILFFLRRFRKIAEKLLLVSSCLSVRMEQIGSHWEDFREILYFSILRKSGEKKTSFFEMWKE
jgi:hypothetical protein